MLWLKKIGEEITVSSTPTHGAISNPIISGDGQSIVFSQPNYDGSSFGTNRGRIVVSAWDGTAWATIEQIFGTTSVPGSDNLFAGELLKASDDFSVFAFSYRDETDQSLKRIYRKKGNASFRVDPFYGITPGTIYSPQGIDLSATGDRLAIYFRRNSDSAKRVQVFSESTTASTSLLLADISVTTSALSISGDGNHLFCGTSVFSWDGATFTQGESFAGATSAKINGDGTRLLVGDSTTSKVYKKVGGAWSQLGSNLPQAAALWISSTGDRIQLDGELYAWNGTDWQSTLTTAALFNRSGTYSAILSSTYGATAYEVISAESPVIVGANLAATAVYAGSTPATSVYYGSKKLWPDAV